MSPAGHHLGLGRQSPGLEQMRKGPHEEGQGQRSHRGLAGPKNWSCRGAWAVNRWRGRQRGCTHPNQGTAFPRLQGTSAFTKTNEKSTLWPVTAPGSRGEGFPWLWGRQGRGKLVSELGHQPSKGLSSIMAQKCSQLPFFFSARAKFTQCNDKPVCRQALSGCCAGPATPRTGP